MAHPIYYVPAGDVLPVFFDTYDGGTGASITMTGLAVTDIEIYKDGSVTQRASDAGYTLLDTDGIDFDSITGIHGFSIDTGDNTDASFYTVGAWFTVVVSAITVDAQTVSFVACQFRIMASESVAGVPEVDTTHVSGTAQTARDLGASVLLSSGTGTGQISLSSGEVTPTTASKTGYRLSATGVDDIWDEALSGHVAAGSAGAALYIIRSATGQAGASTTITLDASASATDDFYNNQRIYIVSGTGAGQGTYITDYNGTTKVATVQDTWRVNPSSDSVFVILPAGGIPGASAPTAADVADAVWDEARADHTAEGSFGARLFAPHEGTAQAGTSSSITLDATGSSATTDFYKYGMIMIIAGTGAGQARQITAYNGSTKVATVALNWTTTPSTDSQYVIIIDASFDAATVAQIADGVWDEARSGHVTAGSFGEYVLADSTRVSGSTSAADGLEAAVAGSTPLPSNVTQISGDATAADNLESYTDGTTPMPVNATQISGDATAADNLEAALDGTGGVTISANVDGYVEVRSTGGSAGHNAADLVTSILTTQMTESYNTDGAAPTLAQALFLIAQRLTESEVSGTTLTVKRLDGSTSAYTLTLDDGANPTSSTRAT